MNFEVPFFRHDLGQAELDAVSKVFSGRILTTGEFTAEFEQGFAKLLGRRYALGLTSCTGALHLSLISLGIGPGDEVITTPMTFIASATSIIEAGARPIFVDVEPDTGNLDIAKVQAAITKRTKAIMPVHLYGLMCNMKALGDFARTHGLKIIEDSAHCIEGEREGIRPGKIGDTACFSFFATKNLTCGEGGALATDNEELYQSLKLLRLHGMNKTAADRQREGYQHWDMKVMGWKYNMDNIHAAILIPQLSRIGANLEKRQALARIYEEGLAKISGVRTLSSRPGAVHARHLFPIRVQSGRRDHVLRELQRRGIEVTVNYRAIHLLSYFSEMLGYRRGAFPEAERFGDEILSLPFYPAMPRGNAETVIRALEEIQRG